VQDIPVAPRDPGYDIVRTVGQKLQRLARRPMLICWGERDFVFDRDYLDEWRKRFPDAEVHSFPDAGHYVLEDESDKIAVLVEDFLRRHPI
jgi:haloalkane dehalogenase